MSAFIESAESRETSVEIMEAILQVAQGSETLAENIWEAPTHAQHLAVIEIATKNGMHDPSDFCWGVMGSDWASV